MISTFITDQDESTRCTLNKFIDDIKLRGMTDLPNRVSITENFDNWANRKFLRFRKEKYTSLHLGVTTALWFDHGRQLSPTRLLARCPAVGGGRGSEG